MAIFCDVTDLRPDIIATATTPKKVATSMVMLLERDNIHTAEHGCLSLIEAGEGF